MADIRLGTQGWSYPDWVGSFYAPGARQADYLTEYARRFDTVEIDSTFYGMPRPSHVQAWAEHSPPDFVFTAKLPRSITHDRRLVDCSDELGQFLAVIGRLGPKLGPLLIQLPPDFRSDERPALERCLDLLPKDYRFAVELRHRSWHDDETLDLLSAHGVAWTITDLPYLPPLVATTARFSYLRWHGERRQLARFDAVQIHRSERDDAWAATLRSLAERVDQVYGYFNNYWAGHAPASVRAMQQRLGLPAREPPPPEQPSLFDALDLDT